MEEVWEALAHLQSIWHQIPCTPNCSSLERYNSVILNFKKITWKITVRITAVFRTWRIFFRRNGRSKKWTWLTFKCTKCNKWDWLLTTSPSSKSSWGRKKGPLTTIRRCMTSTLKNIPAKKNLRHYWAAATMMLRAGCIHWTQTIWKSITYRGLDIIHRKFSLTFTTSK